MALVVVSRIQSCSTFRNKWVACETQLKTVVINFFLRSFEDFAIINCLVKHPPSTIICIVFRAEQLAVNGRLYLFDLLQNKRSSLDSILFYSLYDLQVNIRLSFLPFLSYLQKASIVENVICTWRDGTGTFISRSHTATICEIYKDNKKFKNYFKNSIEVVIPLIITNKRRIAVSYLGYRTASKGQGYIPLVNADFHLCEDPDNFLL